MNTEYENGIFPRWADYLSQFLVIYSLVTFTLETEPTLQNHPFFFISEIIVGTIFAIEYFARIALARNKWGYIFSFYGMVDFFASAPILLSFGLVDLRFARVIRLLRLLRLLKFVRYTQSIYILKEAVFKVRGELFVFMGCIFAIVYLAAVGIHFFEHDAQPERFGSITQSMWWAVVTLTTVGYGDVYPITVAGKLFTVVIMLMGLGIVAIPSGLLASALVQIQQDKATGKKPKDPSPTSENPFTQAS